MHALLIDPLPVKAAARTTARIMPLAACLALFYGCAAAPDARDIDARPSPAAADAASGEPVSTYIDARPAALVDGQSVTWGDLRPILAEMSGAQALDEHMLDLKVAEALQERGLAVDSSDLELERQILIHQLADEPNRALRLLDELRARRGLGEHRFRSLLRRNAGLRALAGPTVNVPSTAVQRQYEMLHGPRRQARIVVVPQLFDAQQAIAQIDGGTDIAEVAVTISTDQSALRGGLLEPISRADMSYPQVLRNTLFDLEPGEVSRPFLIDGQYGVLKLEQVYPGSDVEFADVAEDMQRLARLAQERQAMDRLAIEMLSQTQLTIFDEALNESWRRTGRERGRVGAAGVQ